MAMQLVLCNIYSIQALLYLWVNNVESGGVKMAKACLGDASQGP